MEDTFPVIVNYSKSLAEMIQAGKYDWVNSDITDKHFPVKGSGRVELNAELIHYGKCMCSDTIIQDLDQRGLRPATLAELLAFGEKYPDEQRKYTIVELGSVWQYWVAGRSVAYLCCGVSGRGLDLPLQCEVDWHACYRFLAFRK